MMRPVCRSRRRGEYRRYRLARKMRSLLPSCASRHAATPRWRKPPGEQRHADLVGARIVDPLHGTGLGVERRDPVVVRRHVDTLSIMIGVEVKLPGTVPYSGSGALFRPPAPRNLQAIDVGGGDVLQRRIAAVVLVGADIRPLHHAVASARRGGDWRSAPRSCRTSPGRKRRFPIAYRLECQPPG